MSVEKQNPLIQNQMVVQFAGNIAAIMDRIEQYSLVAESSADPMVQAKALGVILGLNEAALIFVDQKLNPVTAASLGDAGVNTLRAQEMRRPNNGGVI